MPNLITLETKLDSIKGIVPKFLGKLDKLGLATVRDLLWHFPSRYEDYSKVSKIKDLKEGDSVTVRGEVRSINVRRAWKKNMFVSEAVIIDETGGIAATWFNQPFIAKTIKPGLRVNFAGKVFRGKNGELHFYNPSYEIMKGTAMTTHTAGIIPVYPETRGMTSKGFRYLTKAFLDIIGQIPEFIPQEILDANQFPEVNTALKKIHFPRTAEQIETAKARFAFEHLFLIQLANLKLRARLAREHAPVLDISDTKLKKLLSTVPFTLTETQENSLFEILKDLRSGHPMNRLLQGDVGSGKTVVAAIAALVAAENNYQTVFMAPTEVLARQHYHTLTTMFPHAHEHVALITSSEKKKTAAAKIIVGTHALIAKSKTKPAFPKLGLVIIDEQHRFGVEQRAALTGKKEIVPHFLSMSATPIPRTLSLAIFGDLELSTITELPKGRKAIITKVVDPENRAKAWAFIKQHVKGGRQAFFIYPRIETTTTESEHLELETPVSEVKTVKAEYEQLSKKIFPEFKVAMLHGKMKATEKKKVMADFKAGKIDVLASTSVIEVGVDVPNATIMVIEGADRFGLAQLYQFRGRVGRGEHQSFCFLFTDSTAETTHARLQALLEAKNGFDLAEKDLALRGPGQFLGDRQTGMPDLAMNSLMNTELIKKARDSAQKLLATDPELKQHPLLKQKLESVNQSLHLE